MDEVQLGRASKGAEPDAVRLCGDSGGRVAILDYSEWVLMRIRRPDTLKRTADMAPR